MPPGQLSGLLPCLSREKRPPPVSTSVKAFRHFIDGSLALASPDHTCRNLVPAFLQRSPQPLLTAAACSGLRPAPDCRPRGAHPHLLHSTTSPYPGDVFETHGACRPSRAAAPPIFRAPRPARLASGAGFGLVDPEDLNGRRGGEDLAEGMHPALRVLSRASSPAAELVELIEACQLDLELQRRAATLAAGKRHQ